MHTRATHAFNCTPIHCQQCDLCLLLCLCYPGDLVEAHLLFEHYRPGQKYIVAVFKRNGIFVGTQYVPVTRPDAILPTLSLSGNGYDVQVRVHWQNRVAETPIFTVVCGTFT